MTTMQLPGRQRHIVRLSARHGACHFYLFHAPTHRISQIPDTNRLARTFPVAFPGLRTGTSPLPHRGTHVHAAVQSGTRLLPIYERPYSHPDGGRRTDEQRTVGYRNEFRSILLSPVAAFAYRRFDFSSITICHPAQQVSSQSAAIQENSL